MLALAPLRERLGELASRNIFVGTSSWKYEGWLGQLYSTVRYEYRGKIAKTRFEAECLSEYADIFRTVCVDAGFYRFPDEKYIGNLASQVPDGFLLSFKATNEITIKHFPNQQRHGERAGKPNENFLNAELFADSFLGPMSAYREKIGVIMFEFSRFYSSDFDRGRHFVAASSMGTRRSRSLSKSSHDCADGERHATTSLPDKLAQCDRAWIQRTIRPWQGSVPERR
jgi:uncharacterized protein YecE (DUF72 family)